MSKPILEEKDILNPNEAIELFVLSRRKFYKLLKENRKLGFLAMYGSRKLISGQNSRNIWISTRN